MAYRPLTHRAFQWFADMTPMPAVVVGIFVSLLLAALAFWLSWLTGAVADVVAGRAPSIVVRAIVTLYVMVGFLPLACYYLSHWTFGHLKAIRENFTPDYQAVQFPRVAANLFGVFGIVAMYLAFLHQPDDSLLLFQPGRWSADFVIPMLGLVPMGWFNFRLVFLLAWSAIIISRTAQHIHELDLLDPSLVKPYAQQGVRSSLLAVLILSISANLWLDPDSPTIGTVMTVVMLVVSAVVALLLPTWGIHQRLKALKGMELKQARIAITQRRNPQTRSAEDAQQLRADLALERRLMEVSEWPFDAGSYGRVILFILLGFGSWVGAALVESGLESLSL